MTGQNNTIPNTTHTIAGQHNAQYRKKVFIAHNYTAFDRPAQANAIACARPFHKFCK